MHNNVLEFIIRGLATWRVSYMLVKEEGPLDVFTKLRERDIEYSQWDSSVANYTPGNPLWCVSCTSVWVAVAFALLPKWVVAPFAVSALAVAFEIARAKAASDMQ